MEKRTVEIFGGTKSSAKKCLFWYCVFYLSKCNKEILENKNEREEVEKREVIWSCGKKEERQRADIETLKKWVDKINKKNNI